jgi:creatinine amidohydrolase
MTWGDVDRLDRDRTIVFLPLSPIEEHGPHLPLGTDYYGARDIAEVAVRLINEKEPAIECLLAPAIPLGSTEMTMDFPGTISLRGETLARMVRDVCSSFARHGFKYIVISNHHLDPVHVKAILEGINRVAQEYDVKIIESAGRIIYAGMESKQKSYLRNRGLKASKEVHADATETSFIKYHYPHLLKEIYKQLPSVWVDIGACALKGITTFKAMGADQGYIGSPAKATEELGRMHLEEVAELTAELALKLYRNEPLPEITKQMMAVIDSSKLD